MAAGSASAIPLLIGTTRDESAFFAVGSPKLCSWTTDGLRRWMRRVTPRPGRWPTAVIATVPAARAGPGRAGGAPGSVGGHRHRVRVPGADRCGWPMPMPLPPTPGWAPTATCSPGSRRRSGACSGSCHALEIPFVFGTVDSPAVQAFSGGGDDAFALSSIMLTGWASFARFGAPRSTDGRGNPAGRLEWSQWDKGRRPTTVLGPWPGGEGLGHQVDQPRNEELEAVARAVPGFGTGPAARQWRR